MTSEQFDELLSIRLQFIKSVLGKKAEEYATDDKLHNFKEAAKTFNMAPSEVCWNYMMKHLISIKDIAYGKHAMPDVIMEKIGDAINYLILMEAIFLENDIENRSDKQGK